MIRLLLAGLWGCAALSAGAYFTTTLLIQGPVDAGAGQAAGSAEFVKTDMTSVPVIRDGRIEGYVVFQLAVAINEDKKHGLAADPLPYVADAAFQVMYGESAMDFRNIQKLKLAEITKTIAADINRRLGTEVIRDVLIQSLNFVPKDNVRTHWIQKDQP